MAEAWRVTGNLLSNTTELANYALLHRISLLRNCGWKQMQRGNIRCMSPSTSTISMFLFHHYYFWRGPKKMFFPPLYLARTPTENSFYLKGWARFQSWRQIWNWTKAVTSQQYKIQTLLFIFLIHFNLTIILLRFTVFLPNKSLSLICSICPNMLHTKACWWRERERWEGAVVMSICHRGIYGLLQAAANLQTQTTKWVHKYTWHATGLWQEYTAPSGYNFSSAAFLHLQPSDVHSEGLGKTVKLFFFLKW